MGVVHGGKFWMLGGRMGNSIAFGKSTSQRIAMSNAHLSDEVLMGILLRKILNSRNS